jgi:biopolymer transport protein TolR
MIRGDLNVPYNEVVKAMVVLQAAGAPSVGLLTQPPETKRSDKIK